MPHSLKRHEGLLIIDHSASPGTAEVPEGSVLEAATLTCGHCQRQMIRNPLRTRERFHCRGCNSYVCDFCGDPLQTGCKDINRILDSQQEQAFRNQNLKEI
jgi:hypothetical protein